MQYLSRDPHERSVVSAFVAGPSKRNQFQKKLAARQAAICIRIISTRTQQKARPEGRALSWVYLRRNRFRELKEVPNENAFCRTAPSVRFNLRAITLAGVVRASALSSRTSCLDHSRRVLRFRAAISSLLLVLRYERLARRRSDGNLQVYSSDCGALDAEDFGEISASNRCQIRLRSLQASICFWADWRPGSRAVQSNTLTQLLCHASRSVQPGASS